MVGIGAARYGNAHRTLRMVKFVNSARGSINLHKQVVALPELAK